nr:OB-fold domain-containing protein [Myxococcota bacterium]
MSADFPLPDTSWEPLRGFWEGAARDELRIPRCAACGAWNWYPPPRCRRCGGEPLAWQPVSGRGTLFSWCVVQRPLFRAVADLVPYATGLVALVEDPSVRLVTRLVDCDPGALRIDQPVRAVFRDLAFTGVAGAVRAPLFTPA